jgi:hypothetical protein
VNLSVEDQPSEIRLHGLRLRQTTIDEIDPDPRWILDDVLLDEAIQRFWRRRIETLERRIAEVREQSRE